MEDWLQDMLFIYSLEVTNFTLGSNHTFRELHIWMASFWVLSNLLDRLELCCFDIGSHWGMLWEATEQILLLYLWLGWSPGCCSLNLFEDWREKFFTGAKWKSKQLVCLYLVDNLDLLTDPISLLTLVCQTCASQSLAHLC